MSISLTYFIFSLCVTSNAIEEILENKIEQVATDLIRQSQNDMNR